MKQVVILAGGQGTRLKDRLGHLPKPLISIGGKPLLEHHLELVHMHSFKDVLIFTCYRSDLIEEALGDGSRWGLHIRYQAEDRPLGTAGAVLAGFEKLEDCFLVLYGDTMVEVDLERIWQTHKCSGADVTLLLHPNDHPGDSDLVETDTSGQVVGIHHRPHPADRYFKNLVNAGLYVVKKEALRPWRENHEPMDFSRNLFPAMLKQSVRIHGYNSSEFIKDIGTPERLDKVRAQFQAGIVSRSSFATLQQAVFIDRDGTLMKDTSSSERSENECEVLPGVACGLRKLNDAGIRTVVITNQPAVAKGFCSESDIQSIHNHLETLLGSEHAFVDRIYFCPHHPDKGFPGERTELKFECNCRKPKLGMIDQAVSDLNIDIRRSWLIGDTTTDIQTAKNAGVRSVLVRTGYAGSDGKYGAGPDFVCDNFADAVNLILAKEVLNDH